MRPAALAGSLLAALVLGSGAAAQPAAQQVRIFPDGHRWIAVPGDPRFHVVVAPRARDSCSGAAAILFVLSDDRELIAKYAFEQAIMDAYGYYRSGLCAGAVPKAPLDVVGLDATSAAGLIAGALPSFERRIWSGWIMPDPIVPHAMLIAEQRNEPLDRRLREDAEWALELR